MGYIGVVSVQIEVLNRDYDNYFWSIKSLEVLNVLMLRQYWYYGGYNYVYKVSSEIYLGTLFLWVQYFWLALWLGQLNNQVIWHYWYSSSFLFCL